MENAVIIAYFVAVSYLKASELEGGWSVCILTAGDKSCNVGIHPVSINRVWERMKCSLDPLAASSNHLGYATNKEHFCDSEVDILSEMIITTILCFSVACLFTGLLNR